MTTQPITAESLLGPTPPPPPSNLGETVQCPYPLDTKFWTWKPGASQAEPISAGQVIELIKAGQEEIPLCSMNSTDWKRAEDFGFKSVKRKGGFQKTDKPFVSDSFGLPEEMKVAVIALGKILGKNKAELYREGIKLVFEKYKDQLSTLSN